MPNTTILATINNHDENEKLLRPPSTSSLLELMMECSTRQEQGPCRKSENCGHRSPPLCHSSDLVSYDDCCHDRSFRNSDSTSCSSPSIFTDDDSHCDTTESSTIMDGCNTHQNDKSEGVSISKLIHELLVNKQKYGTMSPEVASTYNAIGLFHCRLRKNYKEALHYHTEALRIINTLQEHPAPSLAHDRSDVANDRSESFESTAAPSDGRNESQDRITTLLVTTYMDIGTCYEFQQDYDMAVHYYEKTDDTIIRLEQQSYSSGGDCKTKEIIIPKHITFACRRAIARTKRL